MLFSCVGVRAAAIGKRLLGSATEVAEVMVRSCGLRDPLSRSGKYQNMQNVYTSW